MKCNNILAFNAVRTVTIVMRAPTKPRKAAMMVRPVVKAIVKTRMPKQKVCQD